jgi:predicted RNA methylase
MKRDLAEEEEEEEEGGAMEEELDEYFEGYVRPSVHRAMLGDAPRMRAYLAALRGAQLAGKTVLDVGAGTGLLACWAARLGAARVLAAEASPMARLAREVAALNGLAAVQVLERRVEELRLAPHSVDVLVSEWMGFHLVNESMLDSVLVARDRFLKPGGLMLPARARLLAAPAELAADVLFWSNPACTGELDMSCVARVAVAERAALPSIEIVPPTGCVCVFVRAFVRF